MEQSGSKSAPRRKRRIGLAVQASIAECMAVVIKELPIEGSADFNQMVDVLDKMDGIIHRHRGAAVGGNGRSPISLEAFRAHQASRDNDPTPA